MDIFLLDYHFLSDDQLKTSTQYFWLVSNFITTRHKLLKRQLIDETEIKTL